MAALHEALKSLGPCDFSELPTDDLHSILIDAFTNGQTLVDSVPIAPPASTSVTNEGRSRSTSNASSASEISASSARSTPPPADIEALQKEWKSVKLNPRENPLGMSVYKMGGKDGKGSWFARRSVHEGLGFKKWKKAMEREFPETMKVQGGPGEGNIRGIGGETRVEYKEIEGVGKLEGMYLFAWMKGAGTDICSLPIICAVSWTNSPKRFCNHVPHIGSGVIEFEWTRGSSTFYGYFETLHTPRCASPRRVHTRTVRVCRVYKGDTYT